MGATIAATSGSDPGSPSLGQPAPPFSSRATRAGVRLRAVPAWLNTPAGGLALLILTTLLAQLVFASTLGLGIDESYMVAAGRTLPLGALLSCAA